MVRGIAVGIVPGSTSALGVTAATSAEASLLAVEDIFVQFVNWEEDEDWRVTFRRGTIKMESESQPATEPLRLWFSSRSRSELLFF